MKDLDFKSPIPLHAQLKEIIKAAIDDGVYTEKIPSERELIEIYNVSRSTVREAVASLVRDGILEKIHGKGTFINDYVVNEWLGSIKGFTETIEKMGMKPGARLLSHGKGNNLKIAKMLRVDEYYAIERLRFADEKPIAIERTYYPLGIGRELAQTNLDEVPLYSQLEKLGVILNEAEQKITSAMPSDNDAKLLEIDPQVSVLIIERSTSDPQGKVVEYNNAIYRADKYAFCIKMSRK